MALLPTKHSEVLTVENGLLDPEVMVRTWKDRTTSANNGGILSDVRLTAHEARQVAIALLRAADTADLMAARSVVTYVYVPESQA